MFVATSPRPQRATSVNAQGNVHEIFFPMWSLEEVKRLLRERKGSDLTPQEEKEIEIRFAYFGGVPRRIAKPGVSHDAMMEFALGETKKAIASTSDTTLVDLFNPRSNDPDASSCLIHMKADEDFKNTGKKFASAMVEVELNLRFYDAEKASLRRFLAAAKDIDGFKQTAGTLFESWWHVALQQGADVLVEEMFDRKGNRGKYPVNSTARKVKLPQTASRYSARQKLDDVIDLLPRSGEVGTYLRFLVSNVPSTDSLSVVDAKTADSLFGADSTMISTTTMAAVPQIMTATSKLRKRGAPVTGTQTTTTKTKSAWCMIAYQHAISSKDHLNAEGITRVMDLSESTCGPTPACVHFVIVTTASRASQYHFINVEAEKRFAHVRQWLFILSDESLARLTTSE